MRTCGGGERTIMASESLRMVGPHKVMGLLSCGRMAAYSVMRQLGGIRVIGVGWRVSERALLRYLRELERGDCSWRSSNARAVTSGKVTVTTSTAPNEDESSSQRESLTMAQQNPDRQQRQLQETSSVRSRLEAKLQRAQAKHLGKRSARSQKPRN